MELEASEIHSSTNEILHSIDGVNYAFDFLESIVTKDTSAIQ